MDEHSRKNITSTKDQVVRLWYYYVLAMYHGTPTYSRLPPDKRRLFEQEVSGGTLCKTVRELKVKLLSRQIELSSELVSERVMRRVRLGQPLSTEAQDYLWPLVLELDATLIRVEAEELAAQSEGEQEGHKSRSYIDARMLKMLSDNRESVDWTSREWAESLNCGESTIRETDTWKVKLKSIKALMAVESTERLDRTRTSPRGRRKAKHRSQYD